MNAIENPEDRKIRRILMASVVLVVVGFLATAFLVTVMIAANFNILNWLE